MENEPIQACLDLLEQARHLSLEDERRRLLEQAASDLVRDGRRRRRAARRAVRAATDAELLADTVTRAPDRIMDTALSADTRHRAGLSVHEYVQGHSGPGGGPAGRRVAYRTATSHPDCSTVRNAATSARTTTGWSTTSTASCARAAPTRTSPGAPPGPISPAGGRC